MNTGLQSEINQTLSALTKVLSMFSDEQLNCIPFEGSWTAGQVVQHLIMSNGGFLSMINGPVKQTERSPDKYVQPIRTVFLDFKSKMKSPGFIEPPIANYKKQDLLNSLFHIQQNLHEAIGKGKLEQTCIAFEIPFFGYLTRLEATHFILYHTQRHIHQLKKIFNHFNANKVSASVW